MKIRLHHRIALLALSCAGTRLPAEPPAVPPTTTGPSIFVPGPSILTPNPDGTFTINPYQTAADTGDLGVRQATDQAGQSQEKAKSSKDDKDKDFWQRMAMMQMMQAMQAKQAQQQNQQSNDKSKAADTPKAPAPTTPEAPKPVEVKPPEENTSILASIPRVTNRERQQVSGDKNPDAPEIPGGQVLNLANLVGGKRAEAEPPPVEKAALTVGASILGYGANGKQTAVAGASGRGGSRDMPSAPPAASPAPGSELAILSGGSSPRSAVGAGGSSGTADSGRIPPGGSNYGDPAADIAANERRFAKAGGNEGGFGEGGAGGGTSASGGGGGGNDQMAALLAGMMGPPPGAGAAGPGDDSLELPGPRSAAKTAGKRNIFEYATKRLRQLGLRPAAKTKLAASKQ